MKEKMINIKDLNTLLEEKIEALKTKYPDGNVPEDEKITLEDLGLGALKGNFNRVEREPEPKYFFSGKCGKCKYYGGDVNCGEYSCGCCRLIEHGKPDVEFSDYAYHHSSNTCSVTKEDGKIYKRNYCVTMIKEHKKSIDKLNAQIKDLEAELEGE